MEYLFLSLFARIIPKPTFRTSTIYLIHIIKILDWLCQWEKYSLFSFSLSKSTVVPVGKGKQGWRWIFPVHQLIGKDGIKEQQHELNISEFLQKFAIPDFICQSCRIKFELATLFHKNQYFHKFH